MTPPTDRESGVNCCQLLKWIGAFDWRVLTTDYHEPEFHNAYLHMLDYSPRANELCISAHMSTKWRLPRKTALKWWSKYKAGIMVSYSWSRTLKCELWLLKHSNFLHNLGPKEWRKPTGRIKLRLILINRLIIIDQSNLPLLERFELLRHKSTTSYPESTDPLIQAVTMLWVKRSNLSISPGSELQWRKLPNQNVQEI